MDKPFLTICWYKEDIENAFKEFGIDVVKEDVENILNENNVCLIEEQSVERGWEVIYSCINKGS